MFAVVWRLQHCMSVCNYFVGRFVTQCALHIAHVPARRQSSWIQIALLLYLLQYHFLFWSIERPTWVSMKCSVDTRSFWFAFRPCRRIPTCDSQTKVTLADWKVFSNRKHFYWPNALLQLTFFYLLSPRSFIHGVFVAKSTDYKFE